MTKQVADSLLDLFVLREESPSFQLLGKQMKEIECCDVETADFHIFVTTVLPCSRLAVDRETVTCKCELMDHISTFFLSIGP